jgi:hypothetical protein
MGLPSTEQLEAAALTVVVFGPGFGESIVLRAQAQDGSAWAVIDSARRDRRRSSVNPALDLLVAQDARPSLVLLTHPHADHTGGMTAIIERASPGATIACVEPLLEAPSPYAPSEDPDDAAAVSRSQTKMAHRAIQTAWSAGFPKWPLLHDSSHGFAEWTLTVLHPDQAAVDDALARYELHQDVNLNDVSASLLIERDDIALVLGADGEEAAWTAVALRLQPAHLRHTRPVKVPHHGSRNAIQPVLIDHTTANPGRPQVVTPFPRSGTLPRFDADQGVERLLAAAGSIDLTAMPVDLAATGQSVSLSAARSAMIEEDFEGDPALSIRPQQPTGTGELRATVRDPHESWVLLGVHLDGSVDTARGAHAVRIIE